MEDRYECVSKSVDMVQASRMVQKAMKKNKYS